MNFAIAKLTSLILYPIFGVPFLVLLVVFASLYLSIRLKFINITGFLKERKNKVGRSKKDEVSGFGAFMSAAGSTLGMGNIVGGAIAVKIAGPGSIFWIIIFSLLLSMIKFAETALGHHFRHEDKNHVISGGAFFYIRDGFAKLNLARIGLIFSIIYAIAFIIAYLAAGAFQMNQISSLVANEIINKEKYRIITAILIGFFSLAVLVGGIHRIAKISTALVPFMVICHLFCSIVIITLHIHNFDDVLKSILQSAFSPENNSKYGGMIFVVVYSLQRILFGSDSGTGAAAIANSNSNKSSIQQALIVSIEPMLVALMMIVSSLVVMLTGAHLHELSNGIHTVSIAFANGGNLIKYIFWFNISIFGLTSIISNGYYVEKTWYYLSNGRFILLSKITYIFACMICANMSFASIMPLADIGFNLAIILNVIAIIALSPIIKKILIS
ncbi:alanine:cation symporter family protein [Candidatus Deianiraea vastatrix]|uniref:Amino acid transporter n=1 Tax=Candidatus Deianiraea vastatrix TaxID=2163644 RepID=A0A5B8XFD8_9RICK|nr:alanine:cation symporter family protein [Candidatus Deianiraea vastatrix]QED23645.1 Putative amino acid transporter [Candidatus Deianiraea vastatrix]